MMAAALLHKGLTVLTNVPRIQDTGYSLYDEDPGRSGMQLYPPGMQCFY